MAENMAGSPLRRQAGFYEKYIKRILDLLLSGLFLLLFFWLYLLLGALVWKKLGRPVLFRQPRPGKDERIFQMVKFRTMTNERDETGKLLPDERRMTRFGSWLRSTSLDELPELFNIIKGDMSLVGPRPQLVRDMVFMTDFQRGRHQVRQGLTGLAQVNGRNHISWEEKLFWDMEYVKKITFFGDLKIIVKTIEKALVRREGITDGSLATAEDFGDYLLRSRKVSREEYEKKQRTARDLLEAG